MRPLSPAAAELTLAGMSLAACGVVLGVGVGATDDPRAAGLGIAGAVAVLWVLWGAGAVRRAIRLALPVPPRWGLEATGATVRRVLGTQTLPLAAVAAVAAVQGDDDAPWAPAASSGALLGAAAAALLAAARVRRAERSLGRRLLRQPRWGRLLDRRSLYLEPETLAGRPGGTGAAPWPAHRPPRRPQQAAMELEPANGPARHAIGVGVRSLRPRGQSRERPPRSS